MTNPFDTPKPRQPDPRKAERQAAVSAAFSLVSTRAFFQSELERALAQPSYEPGDSAELVAWREGRKAVLRELAQEIATLFPRS